MMLTLVFTFSEYAIILLLVVISAQRTRWHRKSSRTHPESPNTALPFLDFSPATKSFNCIWPYANKGERCKKPLGAENSDRQWANTLRNTIADDSPYSELVQALLREYAESCLCHHHK